MPRVTRDVVVAAALDLLDEVGLDRVSTRALARRLRIEQPSLYWHFPNKAALLAAMAAAAMEPHGAQPLPGPGDDWRAWFEENTRSFRATLLNHRDGAKLHAGSRPEGESLRRALAKFDFLVGAGLPREPAQMAMLAASRFTVGSVLEEQAGPSSPGTADGIDHEAAFEAGLALIVRGLAGSVDGGGADGQADIG